MRRADADLGPMLGDDRQRQHTRKGGADEATPTTNAGHNVALASVEYALPAAHKTGRCVSARPTGSGARKRTKTRCA